jgi:hypothetical protein
MARSQEVNLSRRQTSVGIEVQRHVPSPVLPNYFGLGWMRGAEDITVWFGEEKQR